MVDDIHFGITHVIRGSDHRPNEALHRRLHEALGTEPPEYVHHGLVLGPDGKKLSKRSHGVATIADLREAGIPAEAVRAYLEELGLPRHDVHLDLPRIRRLAIDAIGVALRRGARRAPVRPRSSRRRSGVPATSSRRAPWRPRSWSRRPSPCRRGRGRRSSASRSSVRRGLDGKEIVRELKAVGGDLKALRLALTGAERGPELWTVIAALPGGGAAPGGPTISA